MAMRRRSKVFRQTRMAGQYRPLTASEEIASIDAGITRTVRTMDADITAAAEQNVPPSRWRTLVPQCSRTQQGLAVQAGRFAPWGSATPADLLGGRRSIPRLRVASLSELMMRTVVAERCPRI